MENVSQTTFTDSGFTDIEVGAELFSMLEVDPAMFSFPHNQEAIKEVAEFLGMYPDEGLRQLRTVLAKSPLPPEERLGRLRGFSRLQMKRIATARELENLDKELSIYL